MMLGADKISYNIGAHTLLKDLSLAVRPGEVLAIIGPNGAGKSTFLKLLSGELAPASGTVTLEGRALSAWGKLECARRRAVMSQSIHIAFPFTAFEIVLLGRSPHSRGNEDAHEQDIVTAAMRLTKVQHLAGRLYDTLSGGEKQRVQLARVVAQIWENTAAYARYLLLDEPIAGMDLAHQHESLQIARAFSQREVGVIVVLHDINLAAMYADKIAIFKDGGLYRCERPQAILTRSIIKDVFDLDTTLQQHPQCDCPLVITAPLQMPLHQSNLHQ